VAGEAEVALIVSDRYQSHGLGFALAQRLMEIAAAEKIDRLVMRSLDTNQRMISICRSLGFRIGPAEDGIVCAEREVHAATARHT
jgi:acetyltransferase